MSEGLDLVALIETLQKSVAIAEGMLAEDLAVREQLEALPVPEEEKAPLRRELDEIEARTVAYLESSRHALAEWNKANRNRN